MADRLSTIGNVPVVWTPANTYRWDSNRKPVDLIIIHDIEGDADAAVSEFQSVPPAAPDGSRSGGSAHFVNDPDHGRFVQMVGTGAVAYGAGNYDVNQRAIQIENPGWSGRPYSPAVVSQCAVWTAWASQAFGVPLTKLSRADILAGKRGIAGHEDVPDPNNPNLGGGVDHHTDPGPTWPWQDFLAQASQQGALPSTGETFFPLTGFSVRGWFAAYYWARGGVASFGYPLSFEFVDQTSGLVTQYFERARFELHGGPDPLSAVQLGRVGAELLAVLNIAGLYARSFTPRDLGGSQPA